MGALSPDGVVAKGRFGARIRHDTVPNVSVPFDHREGRLRGEPATGASPNLGGSRSEARRGLSRINGKS